jgi:hypothetical protein
MTEATARSALRVFVAVGEIERWIGEQPWDDGGHRKGVLCGGAGRRCRRGVPGEAARVLARTPEPDSATSLMIV